MAISYPLSMPAALNHRSYVVSADFAVGRSVSPYTYDNQIQEYEGDAWALSVSLAPMNREAAEPWIGFLLALHGVKGTFYWFDPLGTAPQGIATGTPLLNGANQSGQTLLTKGWTISQTGIMKAGDWFSISGYNSLYKVMQDANSDGSGLATLEIFPSLRSDAIADETALDLSSAQGIFRLSDGQNKIFSVDGRGAYLIGFNAVEAL